MIPVYQPDKFTIGVGIPASAAFVEIRDWVSLTVEKQSQRFTGSKGILGEPFIEMSTDSSVIINVTVLQSSIDVQSMHAIFLLQLTGVVGIPVTMFDRGKDSNVTQFRQKTAYPVGILLDEANKNLSLEGQTWTYRIWSPSGGTIFFGY